MAGTSARRAPSGYAIKGLPANLLIGPGSLLLLLLAYGIWTSSARLVNVTVDGAQMQIRTHRQYVGDLLLDLGVRHTVRDRTFPPVEAKFDAVHGITVERAKTYVIMNGGRSIETSSWGRTARELLLDAEVAVDNYDRVYIDGVLVKLDDSLPEPSQPVERRRYGAIWDRAIEQPVQLQVVRAIPITVDDATLPYTVRTTAQTVGEALRQAEITIYLGDRVEPSLGAEVVPDMRVQIQRSKPIRLDADGRTIRTRTRGETVSDALAELKIGVTGEDRVEPPLEAALFDDVHISITRLREEVEIAEEIAPFETVFRPDTNLAIDTQEVAVTGAEGITRTRYRVRYENGHEVARLFEDRWVAQEPADRVIAYGQKIEPKVFIAPDGTEITYWRRIRMSASSYSAGTAGVSPTAPNYGKTRTGDVMRFGIVAVDPRIIPLRSQVYVPGYGRGDALDTGGAIRSRMIDLGYDDSNLVMWNKWVDVYLLWPPPSPDRITWVIPNYPRVPQ
jgi:resuscitation-promoting factor RpfB